MVLYRNVVKRRFCTGNTLWLPIFFTTAENECVHCTCTASGRKLADNSTDNEHKWQQVISEDTSPPNSNTSSFRPVFSVPFSYFLFIFFFSRCTLPDFPSVSFLASLPFLPCCHHGNNSNPPWIPPNITILSYWGFIGCPKTAPFDAKTKL